MVDFFPFPSYTLPMLANMNASAVIGLEWVIVEDETHTKFTPVDRYKSLPVQFSINAKIKSYGNKKKNMNSF